MYNSGIPFMNPMNFAGNNIDWKASYTAINQNQNNNTQFIPDQSSGKMNFVFKTSSGTKPINILFNKGRTVEDLIKTFFKRVDKENLFTEGGVSFIHNATPINFNEKSTIENFFKYKSFSIIMVIDVNNLIGA